MPDTDPTAYSFYPNFSGQQIILVAQNHQADLGIFNDMNMTLLPVGTNTSPGQTLSVWSFPNYPQILRQINFWISNGPVKSVTTHETGYGSATV